MMGLSGAICYPSVSGYRACDRFNNLCECNGSDWQLIEETSNICIDSIEHNRCYANQEGQVICMPYAGHGTDRCETGYPAGCPCDPPDTWCQEGYTCEPTIKECIKNAYQVPVNVPPNGWDDCESSPNPPWNQSGMQCHISLDDLYASASLNGTFNWEWGLWGVKGYLNIYGYLDGIGYIQLGDTIEFDMWGTEGGFTFSAPIEFPIQGISALLFQCYGTGWTNVKPKSFYGHLNI